jgi:phage/plasmid-like protein (TIGR03299 family)
MPLPSEINGVSVNLGNNMLVRPPVYKGETNPVCLDIVGNKFKPVQNIDAANVFAEYVENGQMTMETAGALKNGTVVWFLAKTTEAFSLAGGDEVRGYFAGFNFHKFGRSMIWKFLMTRVVCANTMAVGLNEKGLTAGKNGAIGEWRLSHSREFDADAIEEMKVSLGMKHAMTTFKDQAAILSTAAINEQGIVRYLARVFAPKLVLNEKTLLVVVDGKEYKMTMPKTLDAVANINSELISGKNLFKRAAKAFNDQPGLDLPSSRGKVWSALNGCTYVLDHVFGNNDESRMYNATIGRSVAIKEHGLRVALEFAKAA